MESGPPVPDASLTLASVPLAEGQDPTPDEQREENSKRSWTILECPSCFSHRVSILATKPPRARCVDCNASYPIKTEKPTNPDPDEADEAGNAEEEIAEERKKIKGSRTAHTHRKKSAEAPDPKPRPPAEEIGALTANLDAIIKGGPDALEAANRQAASLSRKYGEIFEARWLLATPYLQKLSTEPHRSSRLRARYALHWRPKFLAMVAATGNQIIAARHAKVAYTTAKDHREADPDFARQITEADDHATQLLEGRAMQQAIEGNLEPILYMGVVVDYVRKHDTRLMVELLRARMPAKFKTPGNVNVSVNTDNRKLFIMDSNTLAELQEVRRAALMDASPSPVQAEVTEG